MRLGCDLKRLQGESISLTSPEPCGILALVRQQVNSLTDVPRGGECDKVSYALHSSSRPDPLAKYRRARVVLWQEWGTAVA